MAHIDGETKDLSVALIVLVAVLLCVGTLFLITLGYYVRKGRGYVVSRVEKGVPPNVTRTRNGESTNMFVNEAYSLEKVNK